MSAVHKGVSGPWERSHSPVVERELGQKLVLLYAGFRCVIDNSEDTMGLVMGRYRQPLASAVRLC